MWTGGQTTISCIVYGCVFQSGDAGSVLDIVLQNGDLVVVVGTTSVSLGAVSCCTGYCYQHYAFTVIHASCVSFS
jgi:hypothetical protein